MGLGDFKLNNNGKNEQLQNAKNGVRKEQVDKKFHNLFDAYDTNSDGTLESSELVSVFKHLTNAAGEDKILDSAENQNFNLELKKQANIQDADFMGFVKSVSNASADIIESKETSTSDGGKEVTTTYKDGITETIAFYSNGDYKWKKTEKRTLEPSYELIIDGQRKQLNESEFKKAVALFEKNKTAKTKNSVIDSNRLRQQWLHNNIRINTNQNENVERKESYSPRFIAETLGINIATEDGKKVVERLSQLPQETLEKLKDGKELKELVSSQELEPTFDNISNILEITEGVTLRNEEEYKATEAQRQEILTQIKAANFMANLYETLAAYNDQYTDSVGLFGLGSEGIGYVLNKLGLDGENHYQWADSCREFAKNASELKVLNLQKFKEGFKKIYGENADKWGIDYNSNAFKKCFALAESGKAFDKDNKMTDEYKESILKAMNIVADNPNDSTFNQVMNGFGEALIMIATLGWGAETKAGATLATTTMGTFSKAGVAIASKQAKNKLLQGALRFSGQAVKLVGPALNEGTKMYLYTTAEGTLTNVSNRAIKQDGFDKLLDTQAQVMTNADGSFTFGAFAGVFGTAVTQKVMQRVSGVATKVTTAMSEKFSQGAVNANEVFATIMEKSAPTKIAEAAGFATDVVGFTAFESALSIANTLQREGALTPEKLADTLMEEFGHQGYSLGQIKVVSHLIMMLTGSRSARMQSQKYLQENLPQLKGVTVEGVNGGKDGFRINLLDGRKIECKNASEMIFALHLMVRNETALSSKFDMNKVNESQKNNKAEGFSLKDLHVITSKDLREKFNNNSELSKNKWWQENFENVLAETEGKLFAHSKMEQIKKPIDQKKANYARKLLLEKIMDDPELCNNSIIQEFLNPSNKINNSLEDIRSIEQCQNTYSMMKKVVSDSRLQSMENVGELFQWLNDDRYDFQNTIIDRILSDEKLSKNDDFMKDFIQTVRNFDNTTDKVTKTSYLTILDKVTSDEALYKNKSVMKSLNRMLLLNSQTEESAKNVVEFFDSVLKNPLLAENTSIKMALGSLATENQKEILQLLNTICNNEDCKNNENLMKHLGNVACQVNYKSEAGYMIKMIETLFGKQEYKENSSIKDWAYKMIESSKDENNLSIKTTMLETLFGTKEYKNNESLVEWTGKIVAECKTPEEVQAKEKMLKVLFSKEYKNDAKLIDIVGRIVCNTKTIEEANAKTEMLKLLFGSEKYKNNEKLMEQLADIIDSCNTPTDVTVKQNVLDLCLTDKKLTENPNVQDCLGYIVRNSKSDNKVLNLANKYIEEPLLNGNENVQEYAGYIIGGAENEYMKNIMDKYLAEPKLNQNSNLQSMIGKIFVFTSKKEVFESRMGIIDKYLTTPELFNDSSVQNELGNIIARCRTKQQLESSLEFIDNYMADKKAFEEKYGKDNFGKIISVYSADNAQLLEQATKTPNLNKDKISNILKSSYIEDLGDDAGGNAGHIDDAKVQRFMNLLQNPKISPFIVKLLNENVDMDTACFLAKTKQGYYQNKQENNNPYISKNSNYSASQIEFANTLGARGMKKGEIEAILKVVSNNGEVDIKLKTCTLMLLNNEVPHNEVLNMLKSYFIDEAPKKVRQTSTPTTVVGGRTRESIKGLERKIIDQYQPSENVWRSKDETKKWAEEKYQAMKSVEYISTRNTPEDPNYGEKISQQRAEMLNKWYEFMETDEDIKDNPFAKITILRAITEDLLPENSKTAVEFDRAIAKKIIAEAMNDVDKVSFRKAYNNALKSQSQKGDKGEKIDFDGIRGTMFTVPQTDSSSPDFAANVAKVKAYSDGTNWCIRSWNAAPYIQQGAMHFFVDEHGLTQVCIRENSPSNVAEIQKRQQDKTRPIPYVIAIKDFMDRHEIKYPDNYLDEALAAKPAFDKLKNELQTYVAKKDYKGILEKLGITVEVKPDGTWELSHYKAQVDNFTLNDLGINENELLANVSSIKGDADFANSNATSLPKLQYVHGQFKFIGSSLSDIRGLKEINGYTINWE